MKGPFKYAFLQDHPLGTNAIQDARGRTVARFESWIPKDSAQSIASQLKAYPELVAAIKAIQQVDCDADDWHKDPAWERATALLAKLGEGADADTDGKYSDFRGCG